MNVFTFTVFCIEIPVSKQCVCCRSDATFLSHLNRICSVAYVPITAIWSKNRLISIIFKKSMDKQGK